LGAAQSHIREWYNTLANGGELWLLKEDWLWPEQPNALAALTEIAGVERVIAAVRESA
jgi:hypothetical protein